MVALKLTEALSHLPDGCIDCEEGQLFDKSCHPGLAPIASGSTAKNLYNKKPLDLGRWPGDEAGEGHTPREGDEGSSLNQIGYW